MAIKCSLLGHTFGGTEIEEEREEQGSEVVVTIKEIEVCDRCGKQRVVSENKEVTSLAAPDDPDSDAGVESESAPDPEPEPGPDAAETAGAGTGSEPSPGPDMSAAEDDAELLDAGGDDASATEAEPDPDPESTPDIATAGEPAEDEPSSEDDGAVILDDDEPDREPGEWPDDDEGTPEDDSEPPVDEAAAESGEASPEQTADSGEGGAASTTEEWPDEYGYEEESAKAPEVDWPEEGEGEGDGEEWEPGESLTQRIDGDAEAAGTAAVTVPDGEFHCTECEFTTLVEESSLRAGDFCPSCRRGTLEHRAEDARRNE